MGALPSFFYLIIALAALAVAGGLLVWVIRYVGNRDDGRSGEQSQPPAVVEPAPTGERKPSHVTRIDELLRVSRTGNGGLAVYVQGQRYHHLQEIKDPQVGCETIEALKAVLTFAEGWLPSLQQNSPQCTIRKPAVNEQVFLEQLDRGGLLSPRSPARPPLPGPLIPVEVINDLVQKRLQERPDLSRWPICLTTGVGGSLRIYVGLQTFEAVDDIPQLEVRALIHDAIREWEGS
jgi:hypothetical protein